MLISTRTPKYTNAAIIVEDGTAKKIGATFGYSCWHPSGKILTYSMNKVVLFHHAVSEEARDVMDLDSLIAYYVVGSQTIKTTPDLSRKDRLETYPTWSPDGRFLYFCSAPLTWTDRTVIPESYKDVRYDLMRIAYDPDRDEWGPLETVLSAKDTGRSILVPRISPDGRWLLFCMCEYGCFPVYQRSSDLYVIDLEAAKQTGRYEYRRLDVNSDQSESWHSWSSNSRWIAFSSKRGSGVFTRTYLSYVDPNGAAHKPLLLPQKDPTYYDSCLWTYSVPEFVTGPVQMTKESLGRVVRSSDKISVQLPVTTATPKAGAAPATQPYLTTRE
jgi:Tol biopolymer transport system component